MSWLFVTLIPGLLMMATFGLHRVESHLNRGCMGAADVAEFLAQAGPGEMRTLAHEGMAEALDSFQRRRVYTPPAPATANPQFRPTRHADPV